MSTSPANSDSFTDIHPRKTYAEQVAEQEAKLIGDRKRWRKAIRCSYAGHIGEAWSNLHFAEGGKARLAHIAGFIEALHAADKTELADRLVDDLGQQLDWLNGYAGEKEEIVSGDTIKYPASRVVLGDDGTFGGFCLAWYRAVPQEEREQMTEELGGLQDHEFHRDFQRRRSEKFNTNEELTLYRAYHPSWVDEKSEHYRYMHCDVLYRYWFNGGLLFHGLGNDPMAMTLGKNVLWSIHT